MNRCTHTLSHLPSRPLREKPAPWMVTRVPPVMDPKRGTMLSITPPEAPAVPTSSTAGNNNNKRCMAAAEGQRQPSPKVGSVAHNERRPERAAWRKGWMSRPMAMVFTRLMHGRGKDCNRVLGWARWLRVEGWLLSMSRCKNEREIFEKAREDRRGDGVNHRPKTLKCLVAKQGKEGT
jgi:hypothetical protein